MKRKNHACDRDNSDGDGDRRRVGRWRIIMESVAVYPGGKICQQQAWGRRGSAGRERGEDGEEEEEKKGVQDEQ